MITLDELPTNVRAGEPLTIGFTVLQHGKTPMIDLDPTITATLLKDKQFVVVAEAEGKPGHYTATLTFPKEGDWRWSIQAFTMDQPMPVLSVAASEANVVASVSEPVAKTEPEITPISPLLIVRVSALVIGLIGLAFALRRKSRLAVALTVSCLLVGLGSFVRGTGMTSSVEAQGKSSSAAQTDSSLPQVELGYQLFIAKGCVTCHTNTKIPSAMTGSITVDEGPNLTNYSASSDYLTKWLFKPSAIKPATRMPDLNLSENEITALIAFINSK